MKNSYSSRTYSRIKYCHSGNLKRFYWPDEQLIARSITDLYFYIPVWPIKCHISYMDLIYGSHILGYGNVRSFSHSTFDILASDWPDRNARMSNVECRMWMPSFLSRFVAEARERERNLMLPQPIHNVDWLSILHKYFQKSLTQVSHDPLSPSGYVWRVWGCPHRGCSNLGGVVVIHSAQISIPDCFGVRLLRQTQYISICTRTT